MVVRIIQSGIGRNLKDSQTQSNRDGTPNLLYYLVLLTSQPTLLHFGEVETEH